ncbi:hypothetical protein [Oceanobacillus kimchii]|uniref:hypothetical protein n=1 Tax=Oceanobacillus kimchii TaxID=746691 RepID=UPI003B02B951
MEEDKFTYGYFIGKLENREISIDLAIAKRFLILLKEIVNEDDVENVYIKHFEDQYKKEIYLFCSKEIIHINVRNREFSFKKIKSMITEASFNHGDGGIHNALLNIKFENGEEITFNNYKDNVAIWRQDFYEVIKDIYKSL